MTDNTAVLFAHRQLSEAVRVMENGEEIETTNHLANAAQRFIGAAELARTPHNPETTCMLMMLGIILKNIAYDSTSWHIINELHWSLKREADDSDPELPF